MSEKASDYFRRMQNNMNGLKQHIVQDVIAVEAAAFHAKNFRDEGFTDTSLKKWPARKKKDKTGQQRALLVGETHTKGTLKGHALMGRVKQGAVEFIFPLDYEKVHNEGGRAGRGAGFQMPQRQFVGDSAYLRKRFEAKAAQLITQHLKGK